jgi:hypothetical protein
LHVERGQRRVRSNCTFSGELPEVPCGWLAVCVQLCGCGADCKAMCSARVDASVTTYYANDPRATSCAACESTFLTACVKESCAAECAPPDAGTD